MPSRSPIRKRSHGWPSWAFGLLALAPTTSALSLANFQLITSNAIPSPCIVAYNTPIAGCTNTDFTNGNQCSSLCINGLLEEATLVQAICGGLDVNAQSLLGLTLNNNLLETLCPGSNIGTTTVRVTVQPSTSTKTISTSRSQSQTSTTSSSATIVTTTIPSSTQTSISSSITSESSQTTVASTTQTDTSSTTTITSDTTQATGTGTTSTTGQPEATQGGGSPFDAVRQNQAASLKGLWNFQALVALFSAVILLR